ncbi:MAG: tetratricopeptide repeat protein [Chitinispirillaceae bacterium]|nr:tetratricopeptide repeat protein [Chitinispirillaceae bacterium]
MNIKFSQKKQEIREDPVLDFFVKAKKYAVKYANYVLGAAIGVGVVTAFFFIYLQTKTASVDKAQAGFGRAMIAFNNRQMEKAVEEFKTVAESHPATAPGAESALMLGSLFFSMGRYDEAVQWFEMAEANGRPFGFISGEACEGLAGCYEAKGDLPKALEYLEKALADDKVRFRHAAIRWKMALLSRKTNDDARAKTLCREILSDTTAADVRQRAENLLAVLELTPG